MARMRLFLAPSLISVLIAGTSAVAAADRYGATHLLLEPQRAKAWEQVTPAGLSAFGFRLVTETEGYSLFERTPIAP